MDNDMEVLMHIYRNPQTLQSNYVRTRMQLVAKLASAGLVTTLIGDRFGSTWLITAKGIAAIEGYHLNEDYTDEG